MKLTLTMDEVRQIVSEDLRRRGFKLKSAPEVVYSQPVHYDDQPEAEGLSFDLEDHGENSMQ